MPSYFILNPVGFVDDQIAPVELLEDGFFFEHHLVGRDKDVPMTRHDRVANQLSTSVLKGELREGETNKVKEEEKGRRGGKETEQGGGRRRNEGRKRRRKRG